MSAIYTAISRATGSVFEQARSLAPTWLVGNRTGAQDPSAEQSAARTEARDKSEAFTATPSPSGGQSLPGRQAELSIPATKISNADDHSNAEDRSLPEDDTELDRHIASVRADHEAIDKQCQTPPLTDWKSFYQVHSGTEFKNPNSSIPDLTGAELDNMLKRLAEMPKESYERR